MAENNQGESSKAITFDSTGLITSVTQKTGRLITVEENALQGGFGSSVLEMLYDNGMQQVTIKRLGIPDRYIEHGSQAQLRKDVGIDAEGIAVAAEAFIKGK